METPERTFIIRFSVSAEIPDALWDDDDFEEDAWLAEWEAAIKPDVIRAVFAHLRSFPTWTARARNRGISPTDEVEIVVQRTFALPPRPPIADG